VPVRSTTISQYYAQTSEGLRIELARMGERSVHGGAISKWHYDRCHVEAKE
jgi:hypothetical protein